MPEDRPALPFGTIFTSNEWLDVPEGDQELGEVPGAVRTWTDGSAPYPVAGTRPCGTADQFARGDPSPPSPPVQLNTFGGIACCATPRPPFAQRACVNCRDGAWTNYALRSAGANPAGEMAGSDGDWSLTYFSTCVWLGRLFTLPNWPGGPFLGRWQITVRPTSLSVGLDVPAGGGFTELYTAVPAWGCRTLVTVPVNAAGIAAGGGPHVVIAPGDPGIPTTFCAASGLVMSQTYNLSIPTVLHQPSLYVWGLIPGVYPMQATAPCNWSETHWPGLDIGFLPAATMTSALTVLAGSAVQLVMTLQLPLGPPLTFVWSAGGPWDGVSDIALIFQPIVSSPVGFVRLPSTVTIQLPP